MIVLIPLATAEMRMAQKKLDFQAKFLGRHIRVRQTRTGIRAGEDGCYGPAPGEHIHIRPSLRGPDFFETLLHEFLHASNWHIDEDSIRDTARDFTAIFYRPEILHLCTPEAE